MKLQTQTNDDPRKIKRLGKEYRAIVIGITFFAIMYLAIIAMAMFSPAPTNQQIGNAHNIVHVVFPPHAP